ncbi:MAG: VCBS repeat-containing protein, partial [Flavobacteriaceae bacterium]|nr:VCBS repeat-containing protein [Flavobacteriaceae bacterium]
MVSEDNFEEGELWGIGDTIIKDFNSDGHCDVYVSLWCENETLKRPFILYLYDPETGTLVNSSDLISNNVGQPYTRKSLSADFNNDGKLDIINVSHPELFLYHKSYLDLVLSNENGWVQITLDSLSRANSVEDMMGMDSGYLHGISIGDLDNDGDVDFITTAWHDDVMSSYLNNGNATFEKLPSIVGEINNQSFTNELYDVNNDGCLDMIYGYPELYLAYGNCDGTFGPMNNNFSSSFPANFSSDPSNERLDFMDYEFYDLDNDGDEDLVINTGENINVYDDGYWRLFFFRNDGQTSDGTINFQDISTQINQSLLSQGFYVDKNVREGVNYTQFMDVNNDGIVDLIPKTIPGGNRDDDYYHPRWVLYGTNNWEFNYSFYPQFMDVVQFDVIENSSNRIAWEIIVPEIKQCFKDLELGYDTCEHILYTETRAGTEWIIYFSNNSFTNKYDTSVSSTVISSFEEETIDDNPSNYVKRYQSDIPTSISSGNYYFRITHRDEFNLESSLSDEFQLIIRRDSDIDGVLDEEDQCPDTPTGAVVDVNGCEVFTLPVQNFKVEVGSATCVGNSDGIINLSIEDVSYDYSVTITGRDDVTIVGDSKTASITGLSKGTYTVCFKVDGEDDFEQCFEVEVNEPQALSAFMEVNGQNLNITMSGSSQYNIDVNGNTQTTSSNNFETVLSSGLNIIKVYTSLKCQGFVEEQILISEEVYYY